MRPVPDVLDATLEARISRAVHAAIADRRAELEQLIRTRVDLELQALADELVDVAIANGNGVGTTASKGRLDAPATELAFPLGDTESTVRTDRQEPAPLCSRCGERPRVAGRTICKRCRYDQENDRQRRRRAERRTAVDEEPPRPALDADPAPVG